MAESFIVTCICVYLIYGDDTLNIMDGNHKRRKPEAYPAHRDVSLERRPQKVRYYTYGDSLHMLYYAYIILNFMII